MQTLDKSNLDFFKSPWKGGSQELKLPHCQTTRIALLGSTGTLTKTAFSIRRRCLLTRSTWSRAKGERRWKKQLGQRRSITYQPLIKYSLMPLFHRSTIHSGTRH